MTIHLQIIGYILIALAITHFGFPKYFNWKIELKDLSLTHKQIYGVHTFFIAFVVLLMGLLCITSTEELISTNLGKTLSLGLGIFWGIRLLFQLLVYSPKLWRGKTFETIMHVLFTLLWAYMTASFLFISFK